MVAPDSESDDEEMAEGDSEEF
ncbi:uncharacterized protein G2W53_033742 [Senna tora]|uniref:Uncharacterized protein n=1 Tax=Senna tora TaxID=362788 RepID=A0A834WB95_9FABA|nr:uncharacterized protein G2W53_033742 [Senna tora]